MARKSTDRGMIAHRADVGLGSRADHQRPLILRSLLEVERKKIGGKRTSRGEPGLGSIIDVIVPKRRAPPERGGVWCVRLDYSRF